MSTSKMKRAQEYAELLYTKHDFSQKEIAGKVGVSENTIGNWKEKFKWDAKRKSLLTSKEEQLRNFYNFLDALTQHIKDNQDGIADSKQTDQMSKITASIKNLETETNIGLMIETGMAFIKHVQAYDFEFSKLLAEAFDGFIKDRLKRV